MDKEKWLPVVGYEGLYEVSDRGRVRSLDRVVPHQRYGSARRKGVLLRVQLIGNTGCKYRAVGLSKDGVMATRTISRLELEAFVGPRPPGMEACHSNDDRMDDRLTNLRWDTHSGNMRDRVANGGHYNANKSACPKCGSHYVTRPNGRRVCPESRAHG